MMSAKKVGTGVLALAALLSLPQSAGATSPASPAADDVGYRAILNHDWSAAEQQLLAGLEKDPSNVFRQLNLAWVYAQTGRKDEAAMMYRRILMAEQDRVAALPSGEGRSVKSLAERGLSLVQGPN
jgi:Tfp pilus assembly protein PilF